MRIHGGKNFGLAASLIVACVSLVAATGEAQHVREYFYVGGEYITTSTGSLYQNQMYVEKLTPPKVSQKYPIIFLHGGAQTGTNFLNKPDGGRGWASWFLEEGYEVYIVDETTRARSAWNPAGDFPQSTFSAEFISQRFTAVQNYPLWPQAVLHTQWPGTGEKGDPIYDAYYQSNVQLISNGTEQERTMREAGSALLDKVGPAVLITHSQGGLYGWALADSRPEKIKALIQIEPKGPPFNERIFETTFTRPWGLTAYPITYEPTPTNFTMPLATQVVAAPSSNLTSCVIQAEPARKLPNIAKVPVLIDTGEASYHSTYDYCFILFLNQAGVKAEHLELGKVGIHGNAHLQFMEKNSDAIAAKLNQWIQKTVKSS